MFISNFQKSALIKLGTGHFHDVLVFLKNQHQIQW